MRVWAAWGFRKVNAKPLTFIPAFDFLNETGAIIEMTAAFYSNASIFFLQQIGAFYKRIMIVNVTEIDNDVPHVSCGGFDIFRSCYFVHCCITVVAFISAPLPVTAPEAYSYHHLILSRIPARI